MTPSLSQKPNKQLCLVGLMGCGKSSVGELLAKLWELPFYDTDLEIESQLRMTIPEIFKEKGEPFFREVEKKTIESILTKPAGVLSIGGGAFAQKDVRDILLRSSICIYLKTGPETLYERVKKFSHRPLLQNEDPLGTLKKLLNQREVFYLQSHHVVSTDLKSLDQIVAAISQLSFS